MAPSSGTVQTCGSEACDYRASSTSTSASGSSTLGDPMGAPGPGPLRTSSAINETAAARVQLVRDRLKLPAAGSSKAPAGTELTTSILLQHEHRGGLPGETKIIVRTSKARQINSDLGSSSKKWAVSMYMQVSNINRSDIKSAIVSSINVEWLRNSSVPIDDTPSNAPMYLQNVPTMWKHYLKQAKANPFICLEMYLDQGAVNVGASSILKQSEVTFKKITCFTTVSTGACQFVDSGELVVGHILDEPFGSGTMKSAYDLHLPNGEQYVAKRFFKLQDSPAEDTCVSVEDNRVEVEGEIIRLCQGKWFLDAFYRFCKGHKEIIVDLTVEVKKPSKASGVIAIAEDGEGLTWLVEHKRPTTVIKFSGTLVHQSHRTDLRSATVSAFAHFVYGYSNNSLVFADLQGTPSRVKGKDGLVLFDLMTHTTSGESGVGDFGKAGMRTFLDGHKCTKICRGLAIDSEYPLVLPEEEDNEQEIFGSDFDDDEDPPLTITN
ncbi:kinase-like domain-containing protein [Mycena belliarum]|uniref:Kinase-like domain-containing protein n=1 Tax=Mycena belliarum TaxID=1033014 RepID=A0AAD6U5E8_9AGAR|nr:kinase-like domain-containing protein [Mycena belliae]